MGASGGALPFWGPDQELEFHLFEVNDLGGMLSVGAAPGHDRESVTAVIGVARKLCEDVFAPLAPKMDAEEPRMLEGGEAWLPEGVAEALGAFRDAGFFAAPFPEQAGGLDLPYLAHSAASALFQGANGGLMGYPFLTIAAANMQLALGTEDQQRRYMAPMIEGRFFGTMCLSEPQAGSSLADIRTKAEPLGDGTYRITGSKMWISGGEQPLSENIIHHVLAKIPGSPPGVKGISMFITPKFRVGEDGALGARNDVRLAGVNHKMGNRGTINTLLSFGDEGACVGELLGEENKGLAGMFLMMNEARIGVGLGAAALAYSGYAASLAYARERLQGRPIDGRDPTSPMIPIIEHPDVRRMLLRQKAYAEGALGLCLLCAGLVDAQRLSKDDADEAQRLHLLLEILTPIAKAWSSETGLAANAEAIQVLGGYGYTRDYPVERLYRDNRLNPIHEGANGIQALDLLGRKAVMADGAALMALHREIQETLSEAEGSTACAPFVKPLSDALGRVGAALSALGPRMAAGEAGAALSNATPFLELASRTVFGWVWLRQGLAAERAAAQGRVSAAYAKGKLQACRYWMAWELPQTAYLTEHLIAGERSWAEMDEAWF
ncbi:MAG: acyl-CoA dehydrogenase [Pseudomonadota bacterium]